MPGIEVATAYVSMVVTTKDIPKQVNSAFKDAGRSADKAGESMGSSLASGLSKTFLAGVAATAAAGSLAIGTALTKGFQRLTAIDNAEGKLEGLGHSSLSTAKIMDSALASVKGTAFGLGEAATISASAVAAGIKPGQDLTRYLSLTADAATIAGTSIEEMGAVMNKVQTKGKAYTLDLNQLAIRGLPIYQWLAKEMGVTQEALSDMVAEGKVDSATYLAAIEKNIGGAAVAGNTVSAAWANTMAAMGRAGAAALGPTFGRSADWLKGVTAGIDVVTPKVKAFADVMDHRIFNMILPKLQKFGEEGKKAFASFLSENGAGIDTAWSRFSKVFESLGDSAVRVAPAVLAIAGSLAQASGALGVSTWTVFLSALEATAQIADVVLVPALQLLSNLMQSNQGVVTALAAAFLLFKTVPGIMSRIAPSMSSLQSTMARAATDTRAAGTGLSAYQRMWLTTGNAANGTRGAFSRFFADVRANAQTLGAASGSMSRFSGAMLTLSNRTVDLAQRFTAQNTVLGKMGAAYTNAMPGLRAYAAAQKVNASNLQTAALAAKGYGSIHLIAGQAVAGTASAMSRFGAAAGGVGAAGLSAMSSAASGLSRGLSAVSGALGGPVGIALIGATVAYAGINGEIQKSKRFHEALTTATQGTVETQHELAKALQASGGAMSAQATDALTAKITEARTAQKSLVENAPGFWSKAGGAWQNAGNAIFGTGESFNERMKQDLAVAESAKMIDATFKELGITDKQLSGAISGTNGDFKYLTAQLDLTTEAGMETFIWLDGQRRQFRNTADAVKQLTPGYLEMADLMKVMGDNAATATQRSDAMYRSLQMIAGIDPNKKQANDASNKLSRELSGGEVIDQAKGASSELLNVDMTVNTKTENGQSLSDTLENITKAATDSANAGENLGTVFGVVGTQLDDTSRIFGRSREELQAAIEYFGYNERAIEIQVAMKGADDVTKGLAEVWAQMMNIKPGEPKVVTVEKDFDPNILAELDRMGAKITELPNGQTRIDMDDQKFQMKLSTAMDEMVAFDNLRALAGIDVDVKQFDFNAGNADAFMKYLDGVEVKPGADLDIEKLKDQKNISLQELLDLSSKVADPKAFIQGVAPFLSDSETMRLALAKLQDKSVTVSFNAIYNTAQQYGGWSEQAIDELYRQQGVRRNARGSRLPQNSHGSRLPTAGPGTDTVDGILGVGRDGVPTTWVDKGEWIINGKSSEKHNRLLAAINRDDPRLKNLPGFAEGGRNGIDAALSAGRSVDGNTYLWAGTGPERFDCSGFVGWLQQIVMGITGSLKRLYTTHDLMGSSGVAGLQPGLGPAGTQFQVGVSADHMAATIAGHSAESGGAHGTSGIDGGRANAQSSQFSKKWHLPNSEIADWVEGSSTSGGYSYDSKKKVEWTEKNQLDLESATIAIQQAKEARDKVYANSKKSQADREQADKRVQKAEQRVVDLQKKKDDAAAGKDAYDGPAPQAPEMEKVFSDDESERLEAQMQVDDAELRRNEVYADLEASENDRTRADIALQKAQKNLEEVLKGKKDGDKDYSLNGIMKRFAHSAVDAGFSALEGQDYFGLMQSRWFTTDWQKLADDPVIPANPSQADIDGQTGGMPWYERLLRDGEFTDEARLATGLEEDNPLVDWVLRAREMKAPKVFDNGGWLLPGESAINLSTKPEPIFNSPAQLGKFMGGDGLKPAQPAVNDYSVHFHGDVSTRDDAELVSKLRFEQKRMVYGLTGG